MCPFTTVCVLTVMTVNMLPIVVGGKVISELPHNEIVLLNGGLHKEVVLQALIYFVMEITLHAYNGVHGRPDQLCIQYCG